MVINTTTQKLVEVELLTMTKAIFKQIQAPLLDPDRLNGITETAQQHAIALVIDSKNEAWLIIQEESHLWRWNILPAEHLSTVAKEHPWLLTIPQVFLVAKKKRRG